MTNCPKCNGEYCEPCGECHTCGRPAEASQEQEDDMTKFSQKVRGLKVLISSGYPATPIRAVLRASWLKAPVDSWTYPVFARPCPQSPQHGFVESRIVNDQAGIISLLEETLAADPAGELMITQPYEADWNGIWTPSLLTIGPGHDGATSGKGTILYPLAGVSSIPLSILKKAGVDPDQDPYVEIVGRDDGGFKFTQLRAGPKLEKPTPDYIPAPVDVATVIQTNGEDLLKWQAICKDLPAGTVVFHPGGSVTDHYSVHCRLHAIPIMTTRKPEVGEHLEPQGSEVVYDPEAALQGAVAADTMVLDPDKDLKSAATLMLLSLHNAPVMGGAWSFWLGWAAATMLRLGSLALRGEARHYPKKGGPKQDRAAVYARYVKRPLSFHRASLRRHLNLFRYGDWPSSFGGQRWATCGAALKPLFDALNQLAANKDEASVRALISALNVAVNQAHNGGWWLDKFTAGSKEPFDQAQRGLVVFVSAQVPMIRAVTKFAASVDPAVIKRKVDKWAGWGEVALTPPPIKSAEFTVMPGSGALHVSISSTMLGSSLKNIQVPFQKFGPKLLSKLGEVVVVGGSDRLHIECRIKGEAPILLWEEPVLDIKKGI